MLMRTTTGKIALAIAGAALIVGVSACGESSDYSAGPTVADVQNQAAQAQKQAQATDPDPAKRYPPLPPSPGGTLWEDQPTPDGLAPVVPTNTLQPAQDPTVTALQRIQEIAAKTADISNRPEEARNYFNSVDAFMDAVEDEIDGGTKDKLKKGIKDMRAALDKVASTQDVKIKVDGSAEAEKASGDIQLAVYYYAKDNFKPHSGFVQDNREKFCSPLTGCGAREHGVAEGVG